MSKLKTKREIFSQSALAVIAIEQKAIEALHTRIDASFNHACDILLSCKGRVIVTGMGKSGHVGKKIAATLASTGTPAFFIHSAEACHGDAGMIATNDVVLAISYSGETEELINLLPIIRLLKLPLISMTGNPQSTLSKSAHYNINVHVDQEACPLGLAPTASTTVTMVLGDAFAISLLKARGFTSHDFARYHPSGSLGKKLLIRVGDLMHAGAEVPKVLSNCKIADALVEMTQKRLGMTTIVDKNDILLGIFTDGDLRRTLDRGLDVHKNQINQVMTTTCTTITDTMLAIDALNIMRGKKITSLPIINDQRQTTGVIHMHDLLKVGVI